MEKRTAILGLLLLIAGSSCRAQGNITVYITKSGAKYHLSQCSSLRNSRLAIPLADAVKSGYEPCALCKPPVLSGGAAGGSGNSPAGAAAISGGLYRVNAAGISRSGEADLSRLLQAEAVDSVDGDTIRVRITGPPAGIKAVETIRLIGVDTPETVHPRREVEAFGKEASDFTKARLLGKTVYLAFDWDLRDRYGRLLAYVYTPDQGCHNAQLIRQGYGHAYTRFSFHFLEEFRALEREARAGRRGLWALQEAEKAAPL
ncbi:MAG: thermonuclease family protein [Treponema sp.]|jgi:micrococcal nuclease|nr:thermonuclease family protein [Treponema sp.]